MIWWASWFYFGPWWMYGELLCYCFWLFSLKMSSSTGVNGVIWPANNTHILKSLTLKDRREKYWISLRDKLRSIFNISIGKWKTAKEPVKANFKLSAKALFSLRWTLPSNSRPIQNYSPEIRHFIHMAGVECTFDTWRDSMIAYIMSNFKVFHKAPDHHHPV